MNQGSKWSLFFWTILTLTSAQPNSVKVLDVINDAVPGGPYSKFCYGFSTVIATGSVKHGYDTVHQGQSANLHYADCEVVVGNLVLTDLAAADTYDSIKVVTGYLHISNPGTTKVKLGGLQYVLGRELGTHEHADAAVIIEGKSLISFDQGTNNDTFDVELPKLRIVQGKVSLEGLLDGKLNPRVCNQAREFYAKMLDVSPSKVMQHIIFGHGFRSDDQACAVLSISPADPIEICSDNKGYTTPTGCGKCPSKNLAGFCVEACPRALFEYKDGCYFTCPHGTELDDSEIGNGTTKCKECELSFNSGSNQFGYCKRTCFTGFMLPLTRLQFREFYLNPEQGGMRTFKATTRLDSSGYCHVVNGNIVLTKPRKDARWIPSNQMYLMSSVAKVTGMVKIDRVFVPADTFQLLESAWIGITIEKSILSSIDLPLYEGVKFNPQNALETRILAVAQTMPDPKPQLIDLKTDKQMWVPLLKRGISNCKTGSKCLNNECAAPNFCHTGCARKGDHLITTFKHYNRPMSYCAVPEPDHNAHESDLNSKKVYVPCSVECAKGCLDETTFRCSSCRDMTLSTFNLKTCVSVCPHGFYSWMNKECRRCAPECGNNGCYNKKSTEGEEGCKKCDVSFLSRSDDRIFRIQCGIAGSSGFNANYIEQAFKDFWSG